MMHLLLLLMRMMHLVLLQLLGMLLVNVLLLLLLFLLVEPLRRRHCRRRGFALQQLMHLSWRGNPAHRRISIKLAMRLVVLRVMQRGR